MLIACLFVSQADVLIATTVIENGVDMPNVNTIIVLSADR
jgi:transcription-repair coupling factor (superfamily II helicase)